LVKIKGNKSPSPEIFFDPDRRRSYAGRHHFLMSKKLPHTSMNKKQKSLKH